MKFNPQNHTQLPGLLSAKVQHNASTYGRSNERTYHASTSFRKHRMRYAGPILLKDAKVRNPRISKGYICLFVCMVTSAIHLELATDLSTETFLAALRRFFSIRGKCNRIYTDNALDEMQQLLSSSQHQYHIVKTLADEGIQWTFIPPRAPHWGGKWDSAVRCIKLHLRRVIGNTTLTYEQMRTLLAQICAVVNSRPLCYTSDTDDSYLSPAHFLIGRPFTSWPHSCRPTGILAKYSIYVPRLLETMAPGVSYKSAAASEVDHDNT